MMKFILTIVFAISIYAVNAQCWQLVWSDEFNYSGEIDTEKWNIVESPAGWVNNELQAYVNRSENLRVQDSILIIEARKDNFDGNTYTSGRITTANIGDILYGRVEVRAKLPSGKGTWPAIWMLSTDNYYGGWPNSGEIDIMEHVGYDPGVVHASTHTKNHNFNLETQKTAQTLVNTFSSEYHVYGIEWTPTEIRGFIDNEVFFTTTKEDAWGWEEWPFDKKFHVILNVAYGGDWGGARGIDDNVFSRPEGVKMEVDYVRLYKNNSSYTITGNNSIVSNQPLVAYEINTDTSNLKINWEVTGGEIIGADTLKELSVNWGCTGGKVQCNLTSDCDTYVYEMGVDTIAIEIHGESFIPENTENIKYSVPLALNTTYSWAVNGDASIVGVCDSNIIVLNSGTETVVLSLEVANKCSYQKITKDLLIEGQYPYPNTESSHIIPGVIDAVNYDYGGEGIAYHDAEMENQGTVIRLDDGVDTEFGDNGKANVGWMSTNEWLEYTLNIKTTGNYNIIYRVAAQNSGGKFHIEIDGQSITEIESVLATGGWGTFKNYTIQNIALVKGKHVLRFFVNTSGFNLSKLTFQEYVASSSYNNDINSGVKVYPNPSLISSNISISNLNPDANYKLNIFNLLGEFMGSVEIVNKETFILHHKLTKGAYLFELSNNNINQAYKIIIQ